MNLTPYHAKYFAHELMLRHSSKSAEELSGAHVDAQDEVDRQRELRIGEIEGKLQQMISQEDLFTLRWRLK